MFQRVTGSKVDLSAARGWWERSEGERHFVHHGKLCLKGSHKREKLLYYCMEVSLACQNWFWRVAVENWEWEERGKREPNHFDFVCVCEREREFWKRSSGLYHRHLVNRMDVTILTSLDEANVHCYLSMEYLRNW